MIHGLSKFSTVIVLNWWKLGNHRMARVEILTKITLVFGSPFQINWPQSFLAGSGSEETGSSAAGTGTNPLAFLRNQEEFQQMKRLLQQNPGMLNALLQNIGQSNPELLQIISQNQEAFIRMINESDDGSSSGSGGTGSGGRSGSGRTPAAGEEHLGESGVIQVSPQDKEAIERVS